MKKENYRLRKSLASLSTDNPQRVRYFIALKMIAILPPFSEQYRSWTYKMNGGNKQVIPSSLHEALIASHCTSCEHWTYQFAYYHKHLIMLFEIFLNFAHRALIFMLNNIDDLQNALIKFYSVQRDSYIGSLLEKLMKPTFMKKWKDLLEFYGKNQQTIQKDSFIQPNDKKQLSAHYWNATYFSNIQDVLIPVQLRMTDSVISPLKQQYNNANSYGKKGSSLIDELYLQIKDSYPWSVNSKTVWDGYNAQNPSFSKQQYKKAKARLFTQNQQPIDPHQQNITNKRSYVSAFCENYDKYFTMNSNAVDYKILQLYKSENDSQLLGNKKKGDPKNNFYVATISQWQNIANYGGQGQYLGKKYNYRYFTKQENKQINQLFLPETTFNKSLPHYTFAQALYSTKSYCQYLLQDQQGYVINVVHDLIHNNLRNVFSDADFSITNLAFFPYHSWIDLAVEYKIRQMRKANHIQDFIQVQGKTKPFSKQYVQDHYKNIQNNKYPNSSYNVYVQGNPNFIKNKNYYPKLQVLTGKTIKEGNYPIIQYLNPDYISVAFAMRDYSVSYINNQLTIRNSYELNQIYQYYLEANSNKFKQVSDLIFNFNFEIYNVGEDPFQLDQDGLNLPNYLLEFKKQFPDTQLTQQLQDKTRTSVDFKRDRNRGFAELLSSTRPQVSLKTVRMKRTQGQNTQIVQQQERNAEKEQIEQGFVNDEHEELLINKIFSSLLLCLVNYRSNIKNGIYPLKIKVPNLLEKLHQKEYWLFEKKENIQIIENLIHNGLQIGYISVFGKQNRANQCHNCSQFKLRFVDVDQGFKEISKILWRVTHLNSTNEIVYHSKKEIKTNCFLKEIKAQPVPNFEQFRFLVGAEEVEISVDHNLKAYSSAFIRIDAVSASAIYNTTHVVISKKYQTLNNIKPEFFKLHDATVQSKFNTFDKFVYQTIKAWIVIDRKGNVFKKYVEFRIPCFQRFVRYSLSIQEVKEPQLNEQPFTIIVRDIDYEKKLKYFNL